MVEIVTGSRIPIW